MLVAAEEDGLAHPAANDFEKGNLPHCADAVEIIGLQKLHGNEVRTNCAAEIVKIHLRLAGQLPGISAGRFGRGRFLPLSWDHPSSQPGDHPAPVNRENGSCKQHFPSTKGHLFGGNFPGQQVEDTGEEAGVDTSGDKVMKNGSAEFDPADGKWFVSRHPPSSAVITC